MQFIIRKVFLGSVLQCFVKWKKQINAEEIEKHHVRLAELNEEQSNIEDRIENAH